MTDLPCGDSADARYCAVFWEQHAELEELRTQLAADMDEIERLRGLLGEIGVMAANAAEEGDSYGLLEEIAMRIAEPAGMASPPAHQESADALYRERAHLVAFLSSTWPAFIGPAPDVDEPGWAIVYVDSPAGQMTWHIAPRDLDLFGHLRIAGGEWDGHSTAEKYQRLDRLTERQARNGTAPELAAAMAETRQLRELAAEILGSFYDSGDGRRARVGRVQIEKWRRRAGLEG